MDAPAAAVPPATPRWVKFLGLALLVLLVGFVILHLSGGAPMRH